MSDYAELIDMAHNFKKDNRLFLLDFKWEQRDDLFPFRFKDANVGFSILAATGNRRSSFWFWYHPSKDFIPLEDDSEGWLGVELSKILDFTENEEVNTFIIYHLNLLSKIYLPGLIDHD